MATYRELFKFNKKEIDLFFREFKLLYKDKFIKLYKSENSNIPHAKLLIITPKKSGKAVFRNKFRRRIKSIFYQYKLYFNTAHYLIYVYRIDNNWKIDYLRDVMLSSIKGNK